MDTPARLLRFDAYEVDTVHRQLRCDGQPLPLTSKAFDLLCVLIERRHEVVPKNVLMDEVWPGRVVEENNLCQAVAALRRALGTDAHDHRFILTVPRRGYRFVGDVQPDAPRARRRSDRGPAVFDAVAADRALLRARFRLHHRDLSAPRAFLDAIRLDPANADAYAGLAQAYLFLAHQDVAPAEIFPLARAAADQAMAINPDSAVVRLAQGRVLQLADWDWPRAEDALRAAIAMAPQLAEAHFALAHLLVTTGRIDDGLCAIVRARTLSPLSPLVNALEGGFHTAAGDRAAARIALDRALGLEPDFWMALAVRGTIALDEGDPDRAVADLQHAADASGRLTHVLATLALAYVAQGALEHAQCVLAELLARRGAGHVPAAAIAAARLALGQQAEALDELENAHRERAIRMVFLGIDRRWNALRAQPRFRALIDAVALPNGPAYSWL